MGLSTLTQGRDLIMASSGTLICIAFAALTFLCLSHGAPSPTGCDGQNHGIACCEYVEPDQTVFFTTGDNKAKGEKFVQKHQYVGSCRNSCKNLYPAANGITVSKTQKYPGSSYFKCWCELGTPRLVATKTDKKTCMFSEKTPITRAQMNEVAAAPVAEALVVAPPVAPTPDPVRHYRE